MIKKLKTNKCILMVALLATMISGLSAKEYAVKSPDGQVSVSFELKKGTLFYSVSRDGIAVVASSKVEIFDRAKMKVLDHSIRENDSSWEPVWGQFSTIRDHHRELSLSLKADGIPLTMLCRVFDEGSDRASFHLPRNAVGSN